ncbi:MAG TPA: hypothetical protein VEU96_03520 [Bryobacteraceae bacterium]|nr:hypothetical protein [Bryobacteraceae bacterium]
MRLAAWIATGIAATAVAAFADLEGVFTGGLNHPAIEYATRPLHDPIAELNHKIQDGSVQLRFDGGQGYLRSVLDALHVPIESQMMVFSKTSVQAARINPQNPRSLFFNDAVTIGWVRGGFVEAAALDPQQGVHFYELQQSETEKPQFQRDDRCLSCHESLATLGVPGMLLRSVFTAPDGKAMRRFGDFVSDHRSPLAERWGGWYVTGNLGGIKHMGNASEKLEIDGYLSPYSDIAALMVFEHQMHMTNLLTRIGWEVRYAVHESGDVKSVLRDTARELVDYMMFIDEAPIAGKIQGTSGFTEKFAAQGPLRQLDLEHRLMRYPCSYMIYSEAFDSLPVEAKATIYSRMWQILSGQENGARYARLSAADRKAILQILRKTKPGLPSYYRAQ